MNNEMFIIKEELVPDFEWENNSEIKIKTEPTFNSENDDPKLCTEIEINTEPMLNVENDASNLSTDKRPYPCKECDYRASQKSILIQHMKTHTGEKPYACSECDYKASRKSSLRYHMGNHTGDKRFSCERCDYKASRKSYLSRHMECHAEMEISTEPTLEIENDASNLSTAVSECPLFHDAQPSTSQTDIADGGFVWTDNVTRHLLNEYKLLRRKVGHYRGSYKKLYEVMAGRLNKQFDYTLLPKQVEYKISNLLKRYKRLVDFNDKTGRGVKYFKFEAEMEDIFGPSQKKILPEVLLSSAKEVLASDPIGDVRSEGIHDVEVTDMDDPGTKEPRPTASPTHESGSSQMFTQKWQQKSKNHSFYVEYLKERTKFHKRVLEIMEQDAVTRKRLCDIEEERNALFRRYLDSKEREKNK